MKVGGGWGPPGMGTGSAGGRRGRPGEARGLGRAALLLALMAVFAAVLGASETGAQDLSLEAAEQLLEQAFDNLHPAPFWTGEIRMESEAGGLAFQVTVGGTDRLRLEALDSGWLHVWNRGYVYVGSQEEGWLEPSQELLDVYRQALLPFLFLQQVASDPVMDTELHNGAWSLQVRDPELGLLWIDVQGGLPAVIRRASGTDVLWQVMAGGSESDRLQVRFVPPGQPAMDLVLERIATGWVSRAAAGPVWLSRAPGEEPDENLFRPGLLGRLLEALDRFEEAKALGRVNEARQAMRQAIRLDPYRTSLHTQLGILEVENGNWQGALAAFDQAFQLDPEDPLLANNLAYILIDAGLDLQRGVALARQAVDRQPLEPAFLDTLGWGYARTGQLEKGAEILRQALELAEGSDAATRAEIAYHLAETLARLGQHDEARRLLDEALELDPSLDEVLELREALF